MKAKPKTYDAEDAPHLSERAEFNKFKCSCGQIIEPPKFQLTASVSGHFKATAKYKCPNCGKEHYSLHVGRIEKKEKV